MNAKWMILGLALLAGCADYPTKEPLLRASTEMDPSKLTLEQGFNTYVQRVLLPDGTEAGIIRLKDGSSSKYWFRSHHMCKDMGGTWFSMSDGTETYMAGGFCCELQLPDAQMASLKDLKAFIKDNDGIPP